MSRDLKNIYNTDHSVLADPNNIPWLTTLAASSIKEEEAPSQEIVDQATEESDGRSHYFDDGCGKKLYWEDLPVYAVHGQEGLKGGSKFELTWDNINAENDCTAPAKKSELFVNMGAAHEEGLGNRSTTTPYYWDAALRQNKAYYIAVPNERYLLLIQHFIYKFPYFLRDENGNPVDEKDIEGQTNNSYSDIRSIPFKDLTWNPGTNRGADAMHPYVPGCACELSSSVDSSDWTQHPGGAWVAGRTYSSLAQTSTTGNGSGALFDVGVDTSGVPTFTWVSGGTGYDTGDTITFADPGNASATVVLTVDGLGEAEPYADINLAYTNAIVPGSEKTMKYTVTHEDLAQMTYCTRNDTKNYVYNFEGIKPETRFGTEEFFTSILQKQGVDLSDYITEGQYAVFYVGFSPERHADDADCHDQVGFRYAFAFNLKDRPVKQNPSSCQVDPCFVAKFDDVHAYGRGRPECSFTESQEDFGYNTAPKLYDVPQEIIDKYFVNLMPGIDPKSFMEVQYPGKIYRQYDTNGYDIKDKNVTDCLYLAGRRIDPCGDYVRGGKANLTYHFLPKQPMLGIKTSSNPAIIENNSSKWIDLTTPYYTQEEILAESPLTDDITYGISMNTPTLAQSDCNKKNSDGTWGYSHVVSHQYQVPGEVPEDTNCDEEGSCYEYNIHLNLNFDVHTKIAINNTSTFGTYIY
jgi:hypothetical protein